MTASRDCGPKAVSRLSAPPRLILEVGALRRCRWSEPSGERIREAHMGSFSYPGDISVGPNQHGTGSRNRANDRKLPRTSVFDVDRVDPIHPWSDVEVPGPTEVE